MEFESGKIESASCIKIADNFGDLFINSTETSKYPEEKKSTEIPKVAASEIGLALKLYTR
ncbi:hypothetical protein FP741_25620 [Vibrio parahaemolyticus]|nr:hypothetical protein [Vibrio parahaemolyticus]